MIITRRRLRRIIRENLLHEAPFKGKQIRHIVHRSINEGLGIRLGNVDAQIVNGDIILNNSRYELFVGLPFGVEGPKVNVTDLQPTGDSVVVSGEAAGKKLKKPLKPKQIDMITTNVSKRPAPARFVVPGNVVDVIFKKAG